MDILSQRSGKLGHCDLVNTREQRNVKVNMNMFLVVRGMVFYIMSADFVY